MTDCKFLLASVMTKELAVKVARLRLPLTESWVMVVVASAEVPVTNNGPLTVRAVEEAKAKVVWPVTFKVPERMAEAKFEEPVTYKLPDKDSLVPEALVNETPCKKVLPETVKAVELAVAKVVWPVTKAGPETVSAVELTVVK